MNMPLNLEKLLKLGDFQIKSCETKELYDACRNFEKMRNQNEYGFGYESEDTEYFRELIKQLGFKHVKNVGLRFHPENNINYELSFNSSGKCIIAYLRKDTLSIEEIVPAKEVKHTKSYMRMCPP